jgi:hypothetical protein
MAIGTPTARGSDKRFNNGNDVVIPSFTSAADEFIRLFIEINASATAPDSISGHDAGTAWALLGSIETIGGKSFMVYGAHSSGATEAITISRATSSLMGAVADSVTGVDVSGTIANSLEQIAQGSSYTSAPSLTLTGATNLTMGSWGAVDAVVITPEGTELENLVCEYSNCRLVTDYDSAGDASPTASNSYSQNSAYFAMEFKEAAAGGGANPKGPLTHPFHGPFRGPI